MPTKRPPLVSRFLDEINQHDAWSAMKRNPMVILPVGTVEFHGPHMPLGCDGFITQAMALKIAEKLDCLVAPMESYSYIGGPAAFPCGVSVPLSVSMEFLRHIVRALIAGGFRKIVLMSAHMPNETALQAVVREMFEETGVPIVNLRPFSLADDALLVEVLGEHDDAMMEATMLAGALKILGKERLIEPEKWRDVPAAPISPESARRIMKIGGVGFYYTDESSHQAPRANVDADKGILIIERAAEKAINLSKDLDDYTGWLDRRFPKRGTKGGR